MMGTVAQTVHQAAVSVQETDCCPKRGDVVCAMSVRVTREFGVDPPVLCSGMDVRLKWWSVEDETLKDPNPLSPPPPTPPPPLPFRVLPPPCVCWTLHTSALERPFSFRCPLSPPYIIHSVSLSPSTVPLHHLTLSTLSHFLHPLSPFTTLHYPLCLTVSIHCHPFTTLHHPLCLTVSIHCHPFTTLHYPLCLTVSIHCPLSPPYIIHCLTVSIHCPPSPPYIIHSVLLSPSTVPLHHLKLSTLSYCLHPLSPFTTLHYPLCLTVSIHCPPSPPYIIHSVLLSPSTVPFHHLTLSTLSYCLHPLSPFTTLHYPLCLSVSIYCPPSPPYIIHSVLLSPSTVPLHHLTLSTLSYCLHPLSPFTTLHYPLCLTVSIHCPLSPPYIIHSVLLSPSTVPLHHLTLSTLSYCLHLLSPFTTLHYPLCLTVSIYCPPSPPYIIHSWDVLGPAVRASFALYFFLYTFFVYFLISYVIIL